MKQNTEILPLSVTFMESDVTCTHKNTHKKTEP